MMRDALYINDIIYDYNLEAYPPERTELRQDMVKKNVKPPDKWENFHFWFMKYDVVFLVAGSEWTCYWREHMVVIPSQE